ncbi:MAG: DEAD/DEAH box helicase family protein [Bacteroidales bacterium]|nr:DEAD/DEAH box helicase family protein [Bacteroidales bacterium]
MKELNYQARAVNELVEKVIRLLNTSGNRKKLVFEAPTGAGKTVMASQMLSRIAEELPHKVDSAISQVAFIWIAPNKLHEQSYFKMKNYFTQSRILQPVVYDELDHSAGGFIQPGQILFVNWESINKENALMIRETEQCASLYDITHRTQEEHNIPIVVIVDEEHMFGGRNARKSEVVLKNINPKLEIRISATPITNGDEKVKVYREDVIREEMIKEQIVLNPNIDVSDTSGLTANQWLVKEALGKRQEISSSYKKLGVKINPLLLIQLPNDTSEVTTKEDETIREEVVSYLDSAFGIKTSNSRLAVWLSGEKTNLDNIEDFDNITEVLLFKQAIALGWDCPRAAVLLIFRKLESFTFTAQTVGRIMRMPQQKYYTNPLLNKGYVYTDLSRDKIQIVADDMNYISTLTARRRPKLNNVSLQSVYTERKSSDRMRLGSGFKGILKKTMAETWTLIYQPTIFSLFDVAQISETARQGSLDTQVIENRSRAEQFIRLDVRNITIEIPKDITITDELGLVEVKNRAKFARTSTELNRVLDGFCLGQLSQWEKYTSLSVLKNALLETLEELFDINANEGVKIILYYQNQPKFADIIQKALDRFMKNLTLRKASQRDIVSYYWEVPEDCVYNEKENIIIKGVENHALTPFIRKEKASNPEQRFEQFLEDYTQYIDWWYKNGDSGKMNYAIPYVNTEGKRSLFYVDFIIRMKSGQIFLFDTKSEKSDENAPAKHNALIDYMKTNSKERDKLSGGIIIEDKNVWRYSPHKILNTSDLSDWVAFFPDQIKLRG